MRNLKIVCAGILATVLGLAVACNPNKQNETESSTSSIVEKKADNMSTAATKQPTVKAPEAIQPNLFVCKARRLDVNPSKIYFGAGSTRIAACDEARSICSVLTGAATGAVGGQGACVTGPSFDTKQTGIGQTVDQGGLDQGGGAKWICLASEYPNQTVRETRKWAGAGKTQNEAYENAIKLCTSRGGFNCGRFAGCLDTSNASVDAN